MKTTQSKKSKILLILLLTICLILVLIPVFSVSVYAADPVTEVWINDELLYSSYLYLVDGGASEGPATLGAGGCTAQFDPTTGTLYLQNYHGGEIVVNSGIGDKTLTIDLTGINVISPVYSFGIDHTGGGDIIITSSDPTSSLTIDISYDWTSVYAIQSYNGGSPGIYGDVAITGKANITTNLENIADDGFTYAIHAGNIDILDEASFLATVASANEVGNCALSFSEGSAPGVFTIDTTGEVFLDTSTSAGDSYVFYGDFVLVNAEKLTLKWKGYSVPYDDTVSSFTYDPADFDIDDSTPYVEIYTPALPLLSAGSVDRTSDTDATIDFTTTKAGTAYYYVLASGTMPEPTNADVRTLGSLLDTVSEGDNTNMAVTLTAGAMDIYVVVENAAGYLSDPLKIEAAEFSVTGSTGSGGSSGSSFGGAKVTYSIPGSNPSGSFSGDSTYVLGSGKGLIFIVQKDLSQFVNVSVNNVTLTQNKDYTAENGSTKITLRPEYLDTQKAGTYTLTVDYKDKTFATAQFTVAEGNNPTDEPILGGDSGSDHETGKKKSNAMIWGIVLVIAVLVIIGIFVLYKRQQK